MLIQENWGGVLRPKAQKAGKLIMAEEWGFDYSSFGADQQAHKLHDIWDQAHALSVRGIPWASLPQLLDK